MIMMILMMIIIIVIMIMMIEIILIIAVVIINSLFQTSEFCTGFTTNTSGVKIRPVLKKSWYLFHEVGKTESLYCKKNYNR